MTAIPAIPAILPPKVREQIEAFMADKATPQERIDMERLGFRAPSIGGAAHG